MKVIKKFCQNPSHIIGERDQQYRQELIIGICTLPDCKDRLACQQCLQEIHNNHKNFIKKFDEIQQGIWSNYPNNIPGLTDQSVFNYEKEQFYFIKQKIYDYINQIEQQFQKYCFELQSLFDAYKVINLAKEDQILQVNNNDLNSYFYILNTIAQNSQELFKVHQSLQKQIISSVEQVKQVENQCKTEEKKNFTSIVNTYIKQKIIKDYYQSNKLNYDQVPKQYSTVKGAQVLERESLNNKEIYFGELDTTSLKHGKGIQILLEQEIIFEGIWLKNKIVWGQKILLMEKNECVILRGEMKDKKLEGEGQKISSYGIISYGNFQNDQLNGLGKFMRIDSLEKYEGNFKDGKMNGHGKLFYAKGNIYIGEFKNNQRHGKGKLTFVQGDWYEGDFYEDCFHGKGQFYSGSSQKTFIGTFVKGKKQGEFYVVYADKTKEREYYENDNITEEFKSFFKSIVKPKK